MVCKHNFYSFDVFDTCLIRACGKPEFVFDILASRILGNNASDAQLADFALIRREGEVEARKKYLTVEKEEVTIDEVYSCCDFSQLCDVPNEIILNQELEIEKEVLTPVYDIKKLIDNLREVGGKVMFISDMYLPSSFVREVLRINNLYKDGDELYLSSEYGKRKSTGNLYRFVKEHKDVEYKNWIHYGDNKFSDVKIPRKLGIKAKRIFHKQSFYEKLLASRDMTSSKFNMIMMSFISKSVRLTHEKSPEYSVASDFIAPMYVPFVFYIMNNASERGIRNLFFLARDSRIFYDIARVFESKFPQLKIHYLYVSRKSLYLPSITDYSFEEICSCFSSFHNVSIDDVLDKFHMTDCYNKFEKYSSLHDNSLIANLLRDKSFITILKSRVEEQRILCLKYFEQMGMYEEKSAIVDLSGTRKSHVSINKILAKAGKEDVFAYYYEVLPRRIIGKNYEAIFFADRYTFNRLNLVKRPQLIFEQYFSAADHNTTASYVDDGGVIRPVLEEESISDEKKCQIYKINKSVSFTYFIFTINNSCIMI